MTTAERSAAELADFAYPLMRYTSQIRSGVIDHSPEGLRAAALETISMCAANHAAPQHKERLLESIIAVARGLGASLGGQVLDQSHPLCQSILARQIVVSATVDPSRIFDGNVSVFAQIGIEAASGLWYFDCRDEYCPETTLRPIDGAQRLRAMVHSMVDTAAREANREVPVNLLAEYEVGSRTWAESHLPLPAKEARIRSWKAALVINSLAMVPALRGIGRTFGDLPPYLNTELFALLKAAPKRSAKDLELVRSGCVERSNRRVAGTLPGWAYAGSSWTEEGEVLYGTYMAALHAQGKPGWIAQPQPFAALPSQGPATRRAVKAPA